MKKPKLEVELMGGPRDGERFETVPALEYWASHGETWAIYTAGRVLNRLVYRGSILKREEKEYEAGEIRLDGDSKEEGEAADE